MNELEHEHCVCHLEHTKRLVKNESVAGGFREKMDGRSGAVMQCIRYLTQHSPNPTFDNIKIMRAHFILNDVPSVKTWCFATVTDNGRTPSHFTIPRLTYSQQHDIDMWWKKLADNEYTSWTTSDLKKLIFDSDAPFIGEMNGLPDAFNRRLAEMHDLNLKTEIYKVGKQTPGLHTATPFAKMEARLMAALRRCFTHRLTYMIVHFSGVAKYNAGNSDLVLNLELSVFEYVEDQVNQGRFDQNLRCLLLHMHQPQSSIPDLDLDSIKHMSRVLRCVCAISSGLQNATSIQLMVFPDPKDTTVTYEILTLLNPLDVLYEGSVVYDDKNMKEREPDFGHRLNALVPHYTITAMGAAPTPIHESVTKRARLNLGTAHSPIQVD